MRSKLVAIAVVLAMGLATAGHAENIDKIQNRVKKGFAISPVALRYKKNVKDLVGYGSYLVNGPGGCVSCHTYPEYLTTEGDPFVTGDPTSPEINTRHFLGGGQCFGPFIARNITPDPATNLPADLTLKNFMTAMRTGLDEQCIVNPSNPICSQEPDTGGTLQVMPWPAYHYMNDHDLKAIYYYLTAVPNSTPCNQICVNGQPVYLNTADCPNPAPPQ